MQFRRLIGVGFFVISFFYCIRMRGGGRREIQGGHLAGGRGGMGYRIMYSHNIYLKIMTFFGD